MNTIKITPTECWIRKRVHIQWQCVWRDIMVGQMLIKRVSSMAVIAGWCIALLSKRCWNVFISWNTVIKKSKSCLLNKITKRKTFLPSTVPATSWIEEKPQMRSDTATTNFILLKNNKEKENVNYLKKIFAYVEITRQRRSRSPVVHFG